jgi:hypothetical protein
MERILQHHAGGTGASRPNPEIYPRPEDGGREEEGQKPEALSDLDPNSQVA